MLFPIPRDIWIWIVNFFRVMQKAVTLKSFHWWVSEALDMWFFYWNHCCWVLLRAALFSRQFFPRCVFRFLCALGSGTSCPSTVLESHDSAPKFHGKIWLSADLSFQLLLALQNRTAVPIRCSMKWQKNSRHPLHFTEGCHDFLLEKAGENHIIPLQI